MEQNVRPLPFDTYLTVIKNSLGTNLFRNFYALVNGEKKDIMEDGVVSCAFYLTSVLALFKWIERVHGTVGSTIEDLEKSGWKKIKKPVPGSIIVWEGIYFEDDQQTHRHIGFYMGNDRAISNSWTKRVPVEHHWTFGEKDGVPGRKVEAIYGNEKLTTG